MKNEYIVPEVGNYEILVVRLCSEIEDLTQKDFIDVLSAIEKVNNGELQVIAVPCEIDFLVIPKSLFKNAIIGDDGVLSDDLSWLHDEIIRKEIVSKSYYDLVEMFKDDILNMTEDHLRECFDFEYDTSISLSENLMAFYSEVESFKYICTIWTRHNGGSRRDVDKKYIEPLINNLSEIISGQ